MMIALLSVKGSPGVTTTALALALTWPGPVLLAECDPAGGDILAGHLAGRVAATTNLTHVCAAAARCDDTTEAIRRAAMPIGGDSRAQLLPGFPAPGAAARGATVWGRLAAAFADLAPVDVLADCGRLAAAHPPVELLARAGAVVLVVGGSLRSVHAAAAALPEMAAIRTGTAGMGVAVVSGDGPYSAREVAGQLALPLAADLPLDTRAARVLTDGAPPWRRFARSPLTRAAHAATWRLRDLAVEASPAPEPGVSAAAPEPPTAAGPMRPEEVPHV